MPLPVIIPGLTTAKFFVGSHLGVSDWVTVTQERIDAFAEATGDWQWIHCDVERARRESPWKTTIAHGYLSLSLVPNLLSSLILLVGWKTAINTGVERCRLSAPVPAGSRVRLQGELKASRSVPGGGARLTFGVRLEVEGGSKPALIADVTYVYYP